MKHFALQFGGYVVIECGFQKIILTIYVSFYII